MSRLTKKIAVSAVVITLIVSVAAAMAWVIYTTNGARWLLTTAASLSGVSISAQKIQGSISNRLLLSGTRIGLGQQQLELDSVELSWKPLLLLTGTVGVRDLIVSGVRIQDSTPIDTSAPVLAWPKVSANAQLLDGVIARLQVTNLTYRRLQEQPLQVTAINGSATWQDSTLSLGKLTIVSPDGQLQGNISAGFNKPSLTSDLTVALTQPLAEMNRFSLQVRPGTGPEQFVGSIMLSGSDDKRTLLELNGALGMAKDAINLRRLTLTRPGQKGVLTADGALTFTAKESLLSLQVTAAGLDLAPQLNVPTDLSGTLRFAGTLASYRGDVSLTNQARGWQAATVTANYQGTDAGLKLNNLNARIMDGSLTGNMAVDWRNGLALQAVLSGRNLNPARLDPAWKGVANFNASGRLAWSATAPLTGTISADLLESRLHGQALTGGVLAEFHDNDVTLNRLALQGKGFDLQASGKLNQRITLAAQISDFSRLVPGAGGELRSEGWLRWQDRQLSGALTGTGSRLSYAGTRIGSTRLAARLEQGPGYPVHVTAALTDVIYDAYKLGAVSLDADGTLQNHVINATIRSGSSQAQLTLKGGYNVEAWQGTISHLAGSDSSGPWELTAPAAVSVSAAQFTLSPLALSAGAGERLEASADLALKPLSGLVQTKWSGVNLSRANPYLKDLRITGSSSGTARIGFLPDKRLSLSGSTTGSGTFSGQSGSTTVREGSVTFDGGEKGLWLGVDLTTADNGRFKGTFSSTAPFRLALPEKGDLNVDVSGIDLAQLKPWLPADTVLAGRINARAKGILLPGQRFELDGTARLSAGSVQQKRPDGELKLAFSSAASSWAWRGETLSGDLSLVMTGHGKAKGTFRLPLAAHFPLVVNPQGPLRGTLSAQVQEKGLITALFPGLIQESSGDVDTELTVGGTWGAPQIGGTLRLTKAAAYLPTAGIHLKDVQLSARLEKNLIRVDSYRAVSGRGHLEGTATITLAGWRVTGYQGTVGGENFQTVHFPELQLLSSPKLRFEGTPQKLTVRGDLQLPELRIVGAASRAAILPSSDVIREGAVVPLEKNSPLVMDVKVRVLLGEKVFVKVSGIDAQLGGAVDLSFSSLDRITSAGEIRVVKGRYRTYGVNLEIIRGRLFFAGGTINRPSLDVLALRTIGTIRAGVTVSGTLQRPVTRLYSEPAMPDTDILAYIVLGHPLGSSGEQASLLTQAAGALLTSGQAAALQDKIKNHLGLSTLEIQGGVGAGNGSMGYKPLQVTAPGAIPVDQQAGITETVLTVGKYLTPQLYISYGKSLFTGSNLFRLRYDVFKNWQIETQTGSGESGADIYYKMEFK